MSAKSPSNHPKRLALVGGVSEPVLIPEGSLDHVGPGDGRLGRGGLAHGPLGPKACQGGVGIMISG